MVLEALINPVKAEKKPWEMFFIGMIYASIAVIISISVFKELSSIVMIALTAMASIPIIYGAINLEEKKDMEIDDEKILIKEHGKALSFFIFLFLGFTAAFVIWYIMLPSEMTLTVFSAQTDTISHINNHVTGNLYSTTSAVLLIFMNNFKVMLICLLFAFFYGFGAIFILTWNASILATVIGDLIRDSASSYAASYMIFPMVLARYLLHGIPEILAYFTAGLAGGIISIAVIRHDYASPKFKHVLADSLDLMMISIVLLITAAVVEVSVSPLLL